MLCKKKKCFYKSHKIHRKTPVPESLFKKSCRHATLLKKRLWYRCFIVNFTKFLRTPTKHLRWLFQSLQRFETTYVFTNQIFMRNVLRKSYKALCSRISHLKLKNIIRLKLKCQNYNKNSLNL